MSLTRPDLDNLVAYKPGRSPADVARDSGLPEAIKLASNEVPFGPLPGVLDAVAQAVMQGHRYPDPAALRLRDVLAERYDVAPGRLLTGCGSVALAETLARATALPGDEVLYSWRSFEAYPILTAVTGARSVQVPNTADHRHDLSAMAAAITDRTRLVFVCTPNNPTGSVVHTDELTAFLEAVPPNVLVVVDEAYREFITDPDVADGLAVAAGRDNVVVLRTLSKAWGLAGLRVGWLSAPPPVADALRKVLTPFSTSTIAQAAALAALSQEEEMRRRVAIIVAERTRVAEALAPLVPGIPSTQANFVWLPLGEGAVPFGEACEKRGVIVRPFAGDGVRVTIGLPAENDLFLTVAREVLAT